MDGTLEIKLHLKGYFERTPGLTYTDGCHAIIKVKGCNLSYLTLEYLQTIHTESGGGDGPVRFFFGPKNSGIHDGLTEIKKNEEVKLWLYVYEGAPFLELYAAKEGPPQLIPSCVNSPSGKEFDGSSDDNNDGGEDMEEGIEDEQTVDDQSRDKDADDLFDGEGRPEDDTDIWSGLQDIGDLGVEEEVEQAYSHDIPLEDGRFDFQADKENWTPENEDEDERILASSVYPDFNIQAEFQKKKFELVVGHTFSGPKDFRKVLREWVIREGFSIKFLKNESSRITVECNAGCSWRLHASPVQGQKTFRIKTIKGNHTCGRQYKNSQCNSRYVSERFYDRIQDDPKLSCLALKKTVKRDLNIDISLVQAYKAKRKAKEVYGGDEIKQFSRMWDYCETVRKYNPGSTIRIKLQDVPTQFSVDGLPMNVTEGRTFERLYFCLAASKRGFLTSCRPIIGLDGCFLKGNYVGQLLSAIGRDGNDNMFPIAFCIAEAENYNSWKWFLQNLMDDIGDYGTTHLTIISDRQKGLLNAVGELFPNAEHRYCIRHMYENFKKKYGGKLLQDLFWRAASATNPADFRRAMEALQLADPAVDGNENAAGWLEKVSREQWCRAFFSTRSKCDIIVNNLNESFNSCILPAREMTYVSMMDWIRRMLMRMICSKRKMMEKHEGRICPNVLKKIEKLKDLSNHCFAEYSDGRKFGVQNFNRHFVVDLEQRTCTCRVFELTGIPCQHAIAAIQFDRGDIERYVDDLYKKDAYLLAYSFNIYHVPSMEYWEETGLGGIKPPFFRKQPGRPKKLRRRGPGEPRPASNSTRRGLTVRCKKCKMLGHNSRTSKCAG